MKQKDKEEFCELVQNSRNEMYDIAYRILRDSEDAKDAVGEAIIHAYENIENLRDKERFTAWMTAIVLNTAKNIKRKNRKIHHAEKKGISHDETVTDSYDELWDLIEQLPQRIQDVMHLFYYEGYSHDDISDILNVPTGTVKSRLRRGREKLKSMLDEICEP